MDPRHFLQLLLVKVGLNLRSEAAQHQLVYAWWILEPASFVAVFYLVFAVLLQRGGEDFVLFLVCGQVPFLWFSRTVVNASNSLFAGRGLIAQVNIPKVFFPLTVALQDMIKQTFVFALLLCFLLLAGSSATSTWFALPFLLVVQAALVIGASIVVAAVTPVFPDFKFILTTIVMLLMLGSGIFYRYTEILDPDHQQWFLFNPLALLLENYRRVLLWDQPPDVGALLIVLTASILVAIGASTILKRFHGEYSRIVME